MDVEFEEHIFSHFLCLPDFVVGSEDLELVTVVNFIFA